MSNPRSYYSVLGALNYMIPDAAEPVIRQLLDARDRHHGDANTVLMERRYGNSRSDMVGSNPQCRMRSCYTSRGKTG